MPGFILHLTAAQMLRSHLHKYPDFPYPIQSVNDFLIGNLLPDATDQKEVSHFRNPVYRDKMMVFPDLTRFTAKYDSLLSPVFWDIIFIYISTVGFSRILFRRLLIFMMRPDRLQI